jgi:hypothetical protein
MMHKGKYFSHFLQIMSVVFSVACSVLPPFPEIVQYGIHADLPEPGFYGVDNYTHQRYFKSFDDPSMKGGQCVNADHYKVTEQWGAAVKQIAETRCVCH